MEVNEFYSYDSKTKTIKVHDGVTTIPANAFQDFKSVEEIILPDSVTVIEHHAFAGCSSLKKINLPNHLQLLEQEAFRDCISLEEITFPPTLHYISYGLFQNCINLKKLNLHDNINYIDDYGLYNCISLTNFKLPLKIKSLGQMALAKCNSIKELKIPKYLTNIEIGAISQMEQLEKIIVDMENEAYLSDEEVALIDKETGAILQYAIASPKEEYTVGYLKIEIKPEIFTHSLTYNILDYAFAGAKNLKVLNIPSELESIGCNTFLNCPNLKKLNIFFTPYGKILMFHIHNSFLQEPSIPFEEITLEEGITSLGENMEEIFKNIKEIDLPSSLESIGFKIFSKSSKLIKIKLPREIKMIFPETFYPSTLLIFDETNKILAREFNMLQTKPSEIYEEYINNRNNTKIFSLKDGSYYAKTDDYTMIKITKEEIESLSNSTYQLEEDPEKFTKYLVDILGKIENHNSLITTIICNPQLQENFEQLINDIDYIKEIVKRKNNMEIQELLNTNHIQKEEIYQKIVMLNMQKNEVLEIIRNWNPSLERFFQFSKVWNPKEKEENEYLIATTLKHIKELFTYCNIIEKYQKKDSILYHPVLFIKVPKENQEKLIKYYDKNTKRLLKHSKVLITSGYLGENVNDLIKLMEILGAFSPNPILRQKATTFMTEKLFTKTKENGEENEFYLTSDKIHSKFSELEPREELDLKFISFFIKNYQELITIDNTTNGFISRVYNSFQEISKCSTSNKGNGRALEVTVEKCKTFFLMNVFSNKKKKNKKLATLLAKYYDDEKLFEVAESILKEAEKAPRNIYTKIKYNKDGNPIYDKNPANDLIKTLPSGFSYHWLPKQDLTNLILGKHCSSCAHINGAGAGIMRASMILDNCQNLVILNPLGEIIAKSTIWVNKEEGYAVFNNIEVNENEQNEKTIHNIYQAFIEGSDAFLTNYNENNKQNPIHIITTGTNRNALIEELEKNNNYPTQIYQTPDYSHYGYFVDNERKGTYDGDSKEQQILVKKIKCHS